VTAIGIWGETMKKTLFLVAIAVAVAAYAFLTLPLGWLFH
jgi:hypothetical protein